MAGFGEKGKPDAPKGRSTAPSSMIGALDLMREASCGRRPEGMVSIRSISR